MTVSRNEPCPCGSGRKYKKCCLGNDEKAGSWTRMGLPASDPEAAASEPVWQAEIVPVNAFIDEEPDARPAVLLISAGAHPIHVEMLTRPSAEAEDIASELARGIRESIKETHASPDGIQVRFDDVAEGLRALLGPDDIVVSVARALTGLDTCAGLIKAHFWGNKNYPDIQQPQTWAGWGLSEDWTGEFHRAAAAYYRAQPWIWFPASTFVQARLPDGREWSCMVMGDAAVETGISFYSTRQDLEAMLTAGGMDTVRDIFAKLPGRVITMLFDEGGELPPKMFREVMSHGWEVESPKAYPILYVAHAPAGGISARDARDLLLIVEAVAGFSHEKGREINSMAVPEWRDENGVVLQLESMVSDDLESSTEPVWPLEPGGAVGEGADPEAGLLLPEDMDVFSDQQLGVVEDFMVWLKEKGLKEKTAMQYSINVELFFNFLTYHQAVPVTAIHEYDLRLFLYVWYPRKVLGIDRRILKSMLNSLKKLFQFLHEEDEISCPWSGSILSDRAAFIQRWESRPTNYLTNQAKETWIHEGYADLVAKQLLPDGNLGGMTEWAEKGMGREEDELYRELHRRWLFWRDELIMSGIGHPAELHAGLVERQRMWERAPHSHYRHRSPIDVIEDERMSIEEKLRMIDNFNRDGE